VGGTKNQQQHFSNRAEQHLHIEFINESQMALLPWQNWGRNTRQCSHKWFVVCPHLKSMTFTEMATMPDCCMCSQKIMVKRGVTRLRVSQLSGEKTKWSPMGPRFLLHDAADMSIGGVTGKVKFSLWGRMLLEEFCRG
jgi:hypothetical protein